MPIVDLSDAPEVVAIVPTLGDTPRLRECVDSLRAGCGDHRLAILCVVNSSQTDPLQLPDATTELVGVNLGWAGGLQFGANLTTAPVLWLVQDDMTVEPTTLTTLIGALESESTLGVVGPIVVGEDGLVPVSSCGGMIAADGSVGPWLPLAACRPEELSGLDTLDYLPSRGMLVRRAAWDAVGGADPALYPAQFVDVDLCTRLRSGGYGFRLITAARIRHEGGGSTPRPFALFLNARNAETYAARWYPGSAPDADRFVDASRFRPDPAGVQPGPVHPDLDPELLRVVAQSATNTLTHLGRVYGAATTAEAASTAGDRDEIDALRNSRSWRATAPLRWCAGWARQLLRGPRR